MARFAVKTIKDTLQAADFDMSVYYKADRSMPISARNMGRDSSGFKVEKHPVRNEIKVWYTSGTIGYYIPANIADQMLEIGLTLEAAGYTVDVTERRVIVTR